MCSSRGLLGRARRPDTRTHSNEQRSTATWHPSCAPTNGASALAPLLHPQDCRECCGGMGFLAANKIGPLMTDMNVDVTFEGDNTVMMQQVRRGGEGGL